MVNPSFYGVIRIDTDSDSEEREKIAQEAKDNFESVDLLLDGWEPVCIPEITITLKSVPIMARTRKLKSNWTVEEPEELETDEPW